MQYKSRKNNPFITHSGCCCCFVFLFFAVSLHINQEDDGECVHGLLPAAMQPPGCLVKVRAWFPQTLLSRDAWLPHCQLPWTPAVKRTGHWYTHTHARALPRYAPRRPLSLCSLAVRLAEDLSPGCTRAIGSKLELKWLGKLREAKS